MGWGGACACWHRQAAAGQLPQTCGTLVPIAIVAAVCVMQCVIGSRQLNGLHGGVTIGVIVCAKTLVGWAQAQGWQQQARQWQWHQQWWMQHRCR